MWLWLNRRSLLKSDVITYCRTIQANMRLTLQKHCLITISCTQMRHKLKRVTDSWTDRENLFCVNLISSNSININTDALSGYLCPALTSLKSIFTWADLACAVKSIYRTNKHSCVYKNTYIMT